MAASSIQWGSNFNQSGVTSHIIHLHSIMYQFIMYNIVHLYSIIVLECTPELNSQKRESCANFENNTPDIFLIGESDNISKILV